MALGKSPIFLVASTNSSICFNQSLDSGCQEETHEHLRLAWLASCTATLLGDATLLSVNVKSLLLLLPLLLLFIVVLVACCGSAQSDPHC